MILRTALVAIAACAVGHIAVAQQKTKIDLPLQAHLQRNLHSQDELHVFVHGDAEAVAAAVRANGGTVKMMRPGIVSARIPMDRVQDLALDPAVQRFECSLDAAVLLNDSMRVKNKVEPIHQGQAPLPMPYRGTGVLVGIIDTGVDHNHPDFEDADGNTRILKYWDQNLPVNGQTPQPYGYGQVWDQAQIDAGTMTSQDLSSHGTTVAGTAVGNGLATGHHAGVAPEADIIVISAKGGSNFRSNIADAVNYIFAQADALGMPAAVNISLGTQTGSHDGQDAAALFIDDMLNEQGGRVVVCAAGNFDTWPPYHLRTQVDADTSFTWFKSNPNSGLGYAAVFFEVWADTADFNDVHYAIGADRATPTFKYRGRTPFHNAAQNVGTMITDTLRSVSGNRLGIVDYLLLPRGGQYQLQVHMRQPDSSAYNFRFMTTGSGSFDVWSLGPNSVPNTTLGTSTMLTTIPTAAQFPPIVNYVMPDKFQHIVDSWACSDHVITVANYYNEVSYLAYNGSITTVPGTEGAIAATSSWGPTRDDRLKPDLGATGDITLTAAPLTSIASLIANEPFKVAADGMHIRNGGTSMASPVVAGAAALYLQKCPTAPHLEVLQAFNNTALSDAFTGAVPNDHWGHGKLNAFAALVGSNVDPITLDAPGTYCEGTQVEVTVPGDFITFDWSNGGTDNPLLYDGLGPLSVIAGNPSGCLAVSDTVSFTLWPAPATPTVQQVGATLTSSAATGYQWYLGSEAIEGATDQSYDVGTTGTYAVLITDANGCEAESDPLFVLITGITEGTADEFALWPSPATDKVMLHVPGTAPAKVVVRDARGKVVRTLRGNGLITIGLDGTAAGTYHVEVEQGGARWSQRFVKLP